MPTERFTALDASFLYLERPAMHMHVAGVSVLDPSTRPDGRLRFEDVANVFASRLHLAPRLRQKMKAVPLGLGLPVWVDDGRSTSAHMRRAAYPPGSAGNSPTESSACSRPAQPFEALWALRVEGSKWASPTDEGHHAMIDRLGMHLGRLFDLSPSRVRRCLRVGERAGLWGSREASRPRVAPPGARAGHRRVRRTPALAALASARSVWFDILDMGASASPLDVRMPEPPVRDGETAAAVQDIRTLRRRKSTTSSFVVGGALHRLLKDRKEPTKGRTLRVMVPVSVRSGGDGLLGNRVAPAFIDLPVGPLGPKRRLALVREGTRHLKESMMAMSADTIIGLGARRGCSPRPRDWPAGCVVLLIQHRAHRSLYRRRQLVARTRRSLGAPRSRHALRWAALAFGLTGDGRISDLEQLFIALEESQIEGRRPLGRQVTEPVPHGPEPARGRFHLRDVADIGEHAELPLGVRGCGGAGVADRHQPVPLAVDREHRRLDLVQDPPRGARATAQGHQRAGSFEEGGAGVRVLLVPDELLRGPYEVVGIVDGSAVMIGSRPPPLARLPGAYPGPALTDPGI
jgi:hypothetical protein